jgi:heme A synthase
MLKFYRVWVGLLHALIGIQFFLAGYGALGTGSPDESFSLHIMNGRVIAVVALLGILFAALARSGKKLTGLAAGVFGLVVLQSVIALVSVAGTVPGQIIFGFHAINALMIMGLAESSARLAKRLIEERRTPEAVPVAA